MVLSLLSIALAAASGADLRFSADAGEFVFNTGVVEGKLRAEGKSIGILPLKYLPAGTVLTRSMGLAGHYRLFSGPRRFGSGAWYWPSSAKLLRDGSVEVHWPAESDRPFAMSAVYRWSTPSMLDVETRIEAAADLPEFELFMAWYFSEEFKSTLVHAGADKFLSADQASGAWQLFPRDADAVRIVEDGRWGVPPNPVKWTIRPSYGNPIGVRRAADGLTAVVMARPEDCFAVSTPHEADPHHSLYLSLFGKTIQKGETLRARTRTVLLPAATDAEILRLYEQYVTGR